MPILNTYSFTIVFVIFLTNLLGKQNIDRATDGYEGEESNRCFKITKSYHHFPKKMFIEFSGLIFLNL